jgi:group I intron endonuclease
MARKEKKYHYIYKTTNQINGKFYIGMHSTDNLNDGYLGSGTRLWHSIKYYGKENFEINILEYFPNRSLLKERERYLINDDLLKDPMCMNLTYGGEGGGIIFTDEIKAKIGKTNSVKQKGNLNSQFGKCWITNGVENKKININCDIPNGWVRGRVLGKEFSEIMSTKLKGKFIGTSNHQFGTCWITNGIENKKIKKTEIIPNEWKLGRVINKGELG